MITAERPAEFVSIAREFLPRLSERFYRVEGQKGGQAGTGLGLAIVKHILNRHRGGLMVESAAGEGAGAGSTAATALLSGAEMLFGGARCASRTAGPAATV